MTRARQTVHDLVTLLLLAALLGLVYLLPPDTSLAEIRRAGVLRACLPPSYPPLVTDDPQRPGIDVELLQAIAEELDVRLEITRIAAMSRDFNPRSWGISRAQCQIIAGGVVNSPLTRSFLDVAIPHAETGWALIAPDFSEGKEPAESALAGASVGVLVGVSGLDRIALSRSLRDREIRPVLVANAQELAAGLAEGRYKAAVTEALLAEQIASARGWSTRWFDGSLERHQIVFGLWKGDLTLKRAITDAFAQLEADGQIEAILQTYLGAGASMAAANTR